MEKPGSVSAAPFWMVMHPEAVARIIEETLRDDAWWIAARTGRYVQGPTVWADCVRPMPAPLRRAPTEEEIAAMLRRSGREG
jgi:hypothetical protein